MTNIQVSSTNQLTPLQAFKNALVSFEVDGAVAPGPCQVSGDNDSVTFLPQGYSGSAPSGNVCQLTNSRDLDQVDYMIQRMGAMDASTDMNVGDFHFSVTPGAFGTSGSN